MKYAKIYQIGRIKPNESRVNRHNFMDESNNSKENDNAIKHANIKKDFDSLRLLAKNMNLFEPSYFFFVFNAFQIVFFHLLGYYIFWNYGYGLFPFVCASISLIVAQVRFLNFK